MTEHPSRTADRGATSTLLSGSAGAWIVGGVVGVALFAGGTLGASQALFTDDLDADDAITVEAGEVALSEDGFAELDVNIGQIAPGFEDAQAAEFTIDYDGNVPLLDDGPQLYIDSVDGDDALADALTIALGDGDDIAASATGIENATDLALDPDDDSTDVTVSVALDSEFEGSTPNEALGAGDQDNLEGEEVTVSLAVAAFSDPDNPEDE